MSVPQVDMDDGARNGTNRLFACAATAGGRAPARHVAMIRDFLTSDADRLDDRTRAMLDARLRAVLGQVTREIRSHGGRLLGERGHEAMAEKLPEVDALVDGLRRSLAIVDGTLLPELLAMTQLDLLAERLAVDAETEEGRASLLPRLTNATDRLIAGSARSLLAADSRRRAETGTESVDLSADMHRDLAWLVSAAIRLAVDAGDDADVAALDQALVESVERSLAAQDEDDRSEAAAHRLTIALDPTSDALPDLMCDAIADRRLVLFAALLAQALEVDYPTARALVLASSRERLWLALRAIGLPRETIARIGFALCEAQGAGESEAFADMLEQVMDVTPQAAMRPFVSDRLNPAFRDALARLRDGGRAA